MSISLDPYFYKTETLVEAFKRDGVDDESRLREILGKFGNYIGDYYFLMNNERAGDGNPYYNLGTMLDAVFKYSGDMDGFFDTYLMSKETRGITYVEIEDVADELNIELPEPSDDDDA